MHIRSVEDVLKLAIKNETDSAEFYEKWAAAATVPATRELLEGLARDERFHREKLKQVLEGKLSFKSGSVQDLIDMAGRSGEKPVPTKDAGYEVVLTWAMEREKQTYRMYQAFSNALTEPELQQVFFSLADQEQRHYVRLEGELRSAKRSDRLRQQFGSD